MEFIILRPGSGLCNRLRAIGSAIRLAHETNSDLRVEWFRCPIRRWASLCGMSVGFRDLFEPIAKVPVIEKIHVRNDFPWNAWRYSSRNPDYYGESQRAKLVKDVKANPSHTRWLWTSVSFYSIPDFSWVKPKVHIQSRIDVVKKRLSDHCIGVHIRRSDNQAAINGSPLSLFTERMDVEIASDSSATFFISSDSPEVKAELKQRYGDRVVYCKDVAPRYTRKGEEDAVVDLFLLANTKKIYGSYWSSFSEVASQIGGIPLETLVLAGVDLPKWARV